MYETKSHGDMRHGPPPRKKYRITVDDVGNITAVTDPSGRKGVPGYRVQPSLLALAMAKAKAHGFRTTGRRTPDGIAYNTADGMRGIDLRPKVRITIADAKKAPDPEIARLRARLNELWPDETAEERAKRAEAERIAATDVTVLEQAMPAPTRITSVS